MEGYVRFSCGDSDGVIERWRLDTGDGAVLEDTPGTTLVDVERPAFHTYSSPGPKQVTLTVWDDAGDSATESLTACPITGRIVTDPTSADIQGAKGITFVDGALCISTSLDLWFINPSTSAVLSSMPLPGITGGYLAYDGSHLWVINISSTTVYKIDLNTGQVIGSCDVPGVQGLTFDGAYLWNLLNTSAQQRLVAKVDQASGETISWFRFSYGPSVGDIAFDGSALWVAWRPGSYDAHFTRVDPNTGISLESFHIPSTYLALGQWGLCAKDGLPWIIQSPGGGNPTVVILALNPDLWINWAW